MKNPLHLLFVLSFFILPIHAHAQPAENPGETNTYMVFFSFTEQGLRDIRDLPRVEEAKEIVRNLGGEVKAFYGILGATIADTMFILEAPDDETVATMVLTIASRGNVRTETHRLFTEEEYGGIIMGIP